MGCCTSRESHGDSGPACADGLLGLASLAGFCSGDEISRTVPLPPMMNEAECNFGHVAQEQSSYSPTKQEERLAHSPNKPTSSRLYPYPYPYSATAPSRKSLRLQSVKKNSCLFPTEPGELTPKKVSKMPWVEHGEQTPEKPSGSRSKDPKSLETLPQGERTLNQQLSDARKKYTETLKLLESERAYGKARAALRRHDRPGEVANRP